MHIGEDKEDQEDSWEDKQWEWSWDGKTKRESEADIRSKNGAEISDGAIKDFEPWIRVTQKRNKSTKYWTARGESRIKKIKLKGKEDSWSAANFSKGIQITRARGF